MKQCSRHNSTVVHDLTIDVILDKTEVDSMLNILLKAKHKHTF